LAHRASELAPGTSVRLRVLRMGQLRDVAVTLGEFPEQGQYRSSGPAPDSGPTEMKLRDGRGAN
jgi:hypothetical protein